MEYEDLLLCSEHVTQNLKPGAAINNDVNTIAPVSTKRQCGNFKSILNLHFHSFQMSYNCG